VDEDQTVESCNLFLSWSGERSRIAAEAFSDWITKEQSRARPWISTKDMSPGKPWFSEIASRLKLKVGVVFVTPENSSSPWLNFETGAIFNNIGKDRRTFVMLVRFPREGLSANHPLAQLQSVRADEAGCRSIYVDMAEALTGEKQDDRILNNAFTACWPRLRDGLAKVPEKTDASAAPDTTNPLAEVRDALSTQNSMLAQIAREVARLSVLGGRRLSTHDEAVKLVREFAERAEVGIVKPESKELVDAYFRALTKHAGGDGEKE
jgi:hypothetical protein